MANVLFEDSFDWKGEVTIQNWYNPDAFEIDNYGSVRLYVLKDDELLLVEKNDGTFQIPGGKIEGSESPADAALREVLEEVNAVVEPTVLKPVCVIESYKESSKEKKSYELHFVAPSSHVTFNSFEADPAGKIIGNRFVKLSELNDYLKWGKKAEFLSSFLLNYIQNSETAA